MLHPFAGAGICRFRGQKTFRFFYPPCKQLLIKKNVPEPFLVEDWVRIRLVWWTVQDSNL